MKQAVLQHRTKDVGQPVSFEVPDSWKQAAGLLKHKAVDPVKYQREIRKEWEVRLKKLEKIWRS